MVVAAVHLTHPPNLFLLKREENGRDEKVTVFSHLPMHSLAGDALGI